MHLIVTTLRIALSLIAGMIRWLLSDTYVIRWIGIIGVLFSQGSDLRGVFRGML